MNVDPEGLHEDKRSDGGFFRFFLNVDPEGLHEDKRSDRGLSVFKVLTVCRVLPCFVTWADPSEKNEISLDRGTVIEAEGHEGDYDPEACALQPSPMCFE